MPVRTPLGEVRRDGDGLALRFEREYRGSVEDVWEAITTPERLTRWMGEVTGRPAVGETIKLVMGDGPDDTATIRIDICERPERIEAGWWFPGEPWTTLRVHLAGRGRDRTLVTLDHTGFRPEGTAGYGCGWHHFVDALDAELAGRPLPSFDDYYPAMLQQWRAKVSKVVP